MPSVVDSGSQRSPWRVTEATYSVSFPSGASSSTKTSTVHGTMPARMGHKYWTNTANFKTLRKSGNLPENDFNYFVTKKSDFTPFTGFRETRSSSAYSRYEKTIEPRHHGIQLFGNNGGVSWPSVPLHLTTSVVSDLLSRAKGSQFNTPIFVAEGKKTVNMVVSRASSMVYALRALRRGRFDIFLNNLNGIDASDPRHRKMSRVFNKDFGRDPTRAASNMWLEYTYGWTPFMSEVRNAVLTLQDTLETQRAREGSIRSSRSVKQVGSVGSVFYEVSPACKGPYRFVITDSRRACWRFAVNSADLPGRFGLLNPLEVAWELVPFSFVADWFLPIGDYLSSLDVPFRFTHLGGSYGTRRQVDHSGEIVGGDWTKCSGSFSAQLIWVQRTRMTSIPSLRLSQLGFNPAIGSTRAISSIALLRQQLARLAK